MKAITKVFFTLAFVVAATLSASINENTAGDSVQNNELQKSHRDDRLLFFIKILPEECDTGVENTPLGTCREYKSCKKISGTSTTRCAKGLGTCCLDTVTCGGTTSRNNTYFLSPDYPSAYPDGGTCQLTVNKVNTNICQIRIDFISFNLAQPDTEGICNTDTMTVTGGSSSVPTLCGYNTGQHMYVDVDPTGGPLRIRIDADTTVTNVARIFNLQISQIPCTSPSKAPTGCLQYFQSTSGNVMSFNYPTVVALAEATIDNGATRQISSTEYSVCVRPDEGYCSIRWTPDPGFDPYNFFVSGDASAYDEAVYGNIQAVTTGDGCATDYVMIPAAEYVNLDGDTVSADRFCGPAFPTSAESSFTPFNMYVYTDDTESPNDEGNVGFSLNFRQTIC